jgi:hypothetical protein
VITEEIRRGNKKSLGLSENENTTEILRTE